MLSLLTNTSALQAVRSLSQTQASLTRYEAQASTGLKVSTASDNAAYWSIASKMSSRVSALGTVSDALDESAAMISVMSTALNSTIPVLKQMRNDLIAASQPDADLTALDTDIAARQQELISIGKSATFNGQNWLAYENGQTNPGPYTSGEIVFSDGTLYTTPPNPYPHPAINANLLAGYDPTSGVSPIAVNMNDIQLFSPDWNGGAWYGEGILGYPTIMVGDINAIRGAGSGGGGPYKINVLEMQISTATPDDIASMLSGVEQAISAITTGASELGGWQNQVETQKSFVTSLSDSLTNGISALVDADMNDVSTRIAALQVQQQLGVQALGIANANAQSVLKLFQ